MMEVVHLYNSVFGYNASLFEKKPPN